MTETDVKITMFERIGGPVTIDRLVEAFYDRVDTLPEAATIRAMHGPDLARHEASSSGISASGPAGRSSIPSRRATRGCASGTWIRIGNAERDAWLLCMRGALEQSIADEAARQELYDAMAKLADWMRNQAGNPHDAGTGRP